MREKRLRTGFTTGSAATAAAKAALLALLGGEENVKEVDIPLPENGRITIPVEEVELNGTSARASVIKDGGDDPDVTNGARIISVVGIDPISDDIEVIIKGGRGVGRVTRVGLPVRVGEAAINPAPRIQIAKMVKETLAKARATGRVTVTIEVPEGEKIARKTFNPRLGIIGGISILGTRGTVIPFSNEAYRDTIKLALDVAQANGMTRIALTTGGKSEKFLKRLYPSLPDVAFVQVGDFFSFSLEEVAKRGFKEVLYSCFFGKLLKMAQGHPWTHASVSEIDFDLVASWCKRFGVAEKGIKEATTARRVLEIILENENAPRVISHIIERAISSARRFLGPGATLIYHLFDMGGDLLARVSSPGKCG